MSRTVSGWAACSATLVMFCTAPLHAETAVLGNGQRLSISGYEREGSTVRLHVSGGEVVLAAENVQRIEPEEYFPPATPEAAEPTLAESIRAAAERNHLDADLLSSVIAIESRFDPRAVSRKNARGLMQLMPGTSMRLGVRDVFDARQNVEGGARYLREMLDRYGQNLRLALAAYNAGPGRVDRARGIPAMRETRAYVARVLENWKMRAAKSAKARTANPCAAPGPTGGEAAATVAACLGAADWELAGRARLPEDPGQPSDPR